MKRKNILVIEDDQAILDIISYILLAEGYDVTAAHTWEPLSLIADQGADVVLLDEWINARPGSMLCHEIKQIHRLAHLPVIILSTAADIEAIAVSCKADGYVRKPFDIDTLLAEIKRCQGAVKPVPGI